MKTYIGDSVYVTVENGMLRLDTDNGFGPSNTIYLEMEVYERLLAFVNGVLEQQENTKEVYQ